MTILHAVDFGNNTKGWRFWCPACEMNHAIPETGPKEPRWTFNQNMTRPTFTPSIRVRFGDDRQCHSNVTDGAIVFHGDSTHALAGQTVPLPHLDDDQF